jgi:prepilin-type N-terminal cleavage/methylation domain-containing protein
MKLFTKLKPIKVNQGGFTLIELLVVIGILAILLAITLIAINPNKHFEDTRNTQRSSNVSEILNAIYEYESANNGNQPPSVANVTSTPLPVGGHADVSASNTTFSTPDLTFTVPSGNDITSGSVTVSGCTSSGNNGTFSVTSGTDTTIVVTNASGVDSDSTCSISDWTGVVNLCSDLTPTYLAALPMDPSSSSGTQCSGTFDTGYTISASNGRFTISAPAAEDGQSISVTR